MDKEFEEWINSREDKYSPPDDSEIWNASKQYWLDKDRETIERLCDALLEAADYLDLLLVEQTEQEAVDKYRALVKEVKGEI